MVNAFSGKMRDSTALSCTAFWALQWLSLDATLRIEHWKIFLASAFGKKAAKAR
jgi:hypothetical protein